MRAVRLQERFAIDSTWRLLLHGMGVATEDVTRRAGLPALEWTDGTARLPAPEFFRFWSALEELSATPAFPLRIADALRPEVFSPLMFAALCSPDLQHAAARIAQYKALVGPLQLTMRHSPDAFTLVLSGGAQVPSLPPTFALTELLFLVSLVRMGTRTGVRVQRLTMQQLPDHLSMYSAFLGCAIEQDGEYALTVAAEDARRPFLTTDDGMWSVFEPELRRRLSQLGARTTFAERVRSALLEALPTGASDVGHVARVLAVSRRSLQRLLEEEGTSFQELLRDVRLALARHYLERTTLSMNEIAFLLGFAQPTSFYRAFREWTGATPVALRRAHHLSPMSTGSVNAS